MFDRACRRCEIPVGVLGIQTRLEGMPRFANPGLRQREALTSRDPEPPPLEYVRVSGGLFLDMMIHDFDLARFLVTELGPETPWHISRFHPTYKLTDRPVTPVETLRQAREIGLAAGLKYVYTGNVPGEASESTFCHHCGRLLIERWGFSIQSNRVKRGKCTDCGSVLSGIGV